MNDFNNKCPTCSSKNINDEDTGYLPLVYSMKPIKCEDCKEEFEFSERVRISVPLAIIGMFILYLSVPALKTHFGSDITFIIFCIFIVLSIGYMIHSLWKRQFQKWSSNNKRRIIINYGSLILIVIPGVAFYATKT